MRTITATYLGRSSTRGCKSHQFVLHLPSSLVFPLVGELFPSEVDIRVIKTRLSNWSLQLWGHVVTARHRAVISRSWISESLANAMSEFLQTSVLVRDLRTELIVQPFADRILVLVTQMGKVGNLVHSSSDSSQGSTANQCLDPSFHSIDGRSSCPHFIQCF